MKNSKGKNDMSDRYWKSIDELVEHPEFKDFVHNEFSEGTIELPNNISRKNEFGADNFAYKSIGTGKHLIEGLKKLTVTNLGNLTPHPFTVWLTYSHPPVLDRIHALDDVD